MLDATTGTAFFGKSWRGTRSGSGKLDVLGQEIAHQFVAGGAGAAAHHHGDDVAIVALHVGDEVESGRARVAGLDAVDAVDRAKQPVVVADRGALPVERAGREVRIVFREAFLDGETEQRHIARAW